MSLTLGGGPLSQPPDGEGNYEISGPEHAMFFQPFPARLRAMIGKRFVLDSLSGRLLHETGALPVPYVPFQDLDGALLELSEATSECPCRGTASYWSLNVDGHLLKDAVWSYREPKPGHEWIAGFASLGWDAPDAWFVEDERQLGHLRDPYHRVDVFESSRVVTVRAGELPIAASTRPKLLFETGLPARAYLPSIDVEPGLLRPSATRTICPYKGEAWYWSLRGGGEEIDDVAWSYETPLGEAHKVERHLSFDPRKVTVEIGKAAELAI